ncbi:MAG TPA: acetyl-CoA carboxylase biotin carboxyl carrier protein [Candidatus Limnocylindria bacterium]|nr:acetyl-CoA carboxylase biotin carboxyl carrier protein [Candidatus Limnocylindria bacterium]
MSAKPKSRRRPRLGAAPAPADRPVKSRPSAADNSRGAKPAGFELAELRQLIRLVQRTGIGELEVTAGGRTVRIAQGGVIAPHTAAAPAPGNTGAAPDSPAAPADRSENLVAITSPMVGTFYRAPAPDADPYVEMGDVVQVGQTVCILEAMKLMNEIESESKGRIVRILVENAQPVEFGQKLFLLEPL